MEETTCPRCGRPVPVEERDDGTKVAKLYIINAKTDEVRCDQCKGE